MRRLLVFFTLMALTAAMPAGAQMPAKSLARVVNVKVKPGNVQQFEEGLKRFHAWEHQQNYPFTYYAWTIISGERNGQYILASLGHDWKDFDEVEKFTASAGAQVQADLAPYTESVTISYYVQRSDLSVLEPAPGASPLPFSEVITFFLKPGAEPANEEVIKEVGAAIKKSNWPAKPAQWYQLVNGGEGDELILASGRKDWANFQPPEKTLAQMLAEVYGKDGAQALFGKFDRGLRSVRTEIARYRTDLSYIVATP
jgi:hypothetical protein